MRKKIVAGNWKMNLAVNEGEKLVKSILDRLPKLKENRQVVIAPPFTHLIQTYYQTESIAYLNLGAQNCYSEASGAYTGEVSAAMLSSVGVNYVILGHSERREYFNETNAMLTKKVNRALENNLEVIFCCGEPLEIRTNDTQNEYVSKQIQEGIFQLTAEQFKSISIAYEPIWAIGTGRTATTEQAQLMHAHIRSVIADKYGVDTANKVSILYGGSCKPNNAAELFACADVDGGLIGGAALKADEFLAIINAMMHS